MKIYESVTELIGNTPLLEVKKSGERRKTESKGAGKA